jgi:hypothetical protein
MTQRSHLPPTLAQTIAYNSAYNPRHSDYWSFPELRELNLACYYTAVQHPSLLTRYWVSLYLELLIDTPTDGTASEQTLARLRFRLNRIEYYTRQHANALRRYVLLTRVGFLDPETLANEYQHFLAHDPAPIWPWPQTPRPAHPHHLQQSAEPQ